MIIYPRLVSLMTAAFLFRRMTQGFSPRPISQVTRAIPHFLHTSSIIPPTSILDTKLFSTSSITDDEATDSKKLVPLTLLAGFLGSGKTTTLKNLLTNSDGLKIGIIVNDIASINIDAKLLSNPNVSNDETIELQNGCACCSLADELLTSVEQLMDNGNRKFDAIVVELSGVADPVQVKTNWEQAQFLNHPATELAEMDKIVTLIDSSTFGTDWMTWDSSGDREGWIDPNDPCGKTAEKNVPELLAEQVEAADVLIINKIDLAGEVQVRIASGLANSLNDKATVFETEFGAVSIQQVLQAVRVIDMDDKKEEDVCEDAACTDSSHDHSSHSHDHDNSCTEPECTDTSHSHDHAEHAEDSCAEPKCTDTSHSHDHAEHADSCAEPGCTDTSHSHSHDHTDDSCSDPGCTDTSHDHSHSHEHQSTSADNLGISNFVYKATRPFSPQRLLTILNKWPVPIKEELDLGQLVDAVEEGYNIDGNEEKSVFVGVLRSKGFCWMAPTTWAGANADVWRHNTAMYWSHAGKHFGISTAGKWWGTIKKEQMKKYFVNNLKEFERIHNEDFVTEEFGDRRQEIVFIGASISEEEITAVLDECLCTDEEMAVYRHQLANQEQRTFPTSFKPVSPDGPSSIDTERTEHLDEV